MEWFRWYHGACSDAKWPLIARKAGVSVGVVVSVWAALLEHASQDDERGSVEAFDPETYDALYGYEDGTCLAVINAMGTKGIIKDATIAAWEKRQPRREREDSSTSSRVREHREKKRQDAGSTQNHETPCNASETPCNATKRHVTPCNATREEKRREEIREDSLRSSSCPDREIRDHGLQKDKASCSSTAELQETPPAILLPLNSGPEFPISEQDIASWSELYPAVDVPQALRSIRGWLLSNPSKRKTRRGILRFVNGWLSRDQDRGGSLTVRDGPGTKKTIPLARTQAQKNKQDLQILADFVLQADKELYNGLSQNNSHGTRPHGLALPPCPRPQGNLCHDHGLD